MKTVALKKERFVTDAAGKRVGVLLDLKVYLELREAQEDLADVRAYDAARAKARAEVAAGQFVTLAEYRSRRIRKRK